VAACIKALTGVGYIGLPIPVCFYPSPNSSKKYILKNICNANGY